MTDRLRELVVMAAARPNDHGKCPCHCVAITEKELECATKIPAVLDQWPMVGRDQEISAIMRSIDDDAARGVALAGKAGVGKSRLAREAVLAAAAGWTVRNIAATATSRSVALGAFWQWTDGTETAPFALVRRVIEALTDDTQPDRLVVLVDDAHLLDDLSALVLHQLVHSRAAAVIVTIRTGEPAPAAVTALWKDGLLRRHELEPLTRNEIDDLLAATLGAAPDRQCADKLWHLTRGNVLFLRQLVEQEHRAGRMVAQQGAVSWPGNTAISGSLAELVDAQIGAIPGDVCDVVDLVAISEPVDWECLRLVADPDAIEEAEERELIRTASGEVYVGHPLYAEVRLNRCGASRLRRLRGQVATAMKDGGGLRSSSSGDCCGWSPTFRPSRTCCWRRPRLRVRCWTSRRRSGFSPLLPQPVSAHRHGSRWLTPCS
ncbi:AAA family ATPase [Mycobacterium sp.]|uniref:AAA family ATPase n=1 Tax=Mycobacterium sp. TaxID=1785 RepID=UPI003C70BE25